MELDSTTRKRFEAKYIPVPESGCWIWTGAKKSGGYGHMVVGDKYEKAHRISMELAGQNPDGHLVCHKCNTPLCVNPSHLYLGDHQANSDDKVSAERHRRKLTDEQVKEIWKSDEEHTQLAKRMGVCITAIFKVRAGMTYQRITEKLGTGPKFKPNHKGDSL